MWIQTRGLFDTGSGMEKFGSSLNIPYLLHCHCAMENVADELFQGNLVAEKSRIHWSEMHGSPDPDPYHNARIHSSVPVRACAYPHGLP
jgi:hypothetical protein